MIDLIGEPGMSVQTRPFTSAGDQAVWLNEALARIGLRKVHLVGVSIGGWSGVNLALAAPDFIASLALLDPMSVFGRITWKAIIVSLGSVLPFMPQTIRMKLLSLISGGAQAGEKVPIAKLIASGMRDYTNKIPLPTYPSDAQLHSITVPVLALIAGRSIVHDPKQVVRATAAAMACGTSEIYHVLGETSPSRLDRGVGY